MKECVHLIKVLTATTNKDQVSFLALEPVLDSVLSTYINTSANHRATMLGYKQVEKMIEKGNAVEGKNPDGDSTIVGKLYRNEDDGFSDQKVRDIVSKSVGGVDLSGINVEEGVPGQDGNASCISKAGSVCLSYQVRQGYTTFYVRGKDTDFDEDFHRRYSVVDWGNGSDSKLMVLDVDSGEFISLVNDSSVFGRHVENAYKVSMAEDVDLTIPSTKIAKRTTYVVEGEAEEVDVENLTSDPAEVAGKSLGIVTEEADDYESLLQDELEKSVDGEGIAALAGARDKGFLKEGGTVMMPEKEEKVSVIELESLFD